MEPELREGGLSSRLGWLVEAVFLVALMAVVVACGGREAGGRDARRAPAGAREGRSVGFHDVDVGLSGRQPAGWYRARSLTNLVFPRELLALATYPLRGGSKAGECAPDKARADMPADGAFIWLLELRPQQGDAWAELQRSRFPPKPSRFGIARADLASGVSCFAGPGFSMTFRAGDRPFQLLVAFGQAPSARRLDEVEGILDSLAFDPLPAPPPDPYAGWPLVNDNPGDSIRVPPGWAGSAAMFPRSLAPPRALLFASNVPLAGLPQTLVPYLDKLPGPFPSEALNSFPLNGVLVWVLEEGQAGAAPDFPPIQEGWPRRSDFNEAKPPTNTAANVSWLRTGASFRGYRASVWIAMGPKAGSHDRALALKSAASLGLAGCGRNSNDDCPKE